ncbi:cytochrome c biogenesis protein DipZ [Magnetospirillum molischianum]|uniref:Cytochrome c biogenesis protein, transmembrane region n=1 Tax=Magnetospirillum molischianum DSM 120 TaxID=1150626 RepID=H8FPW2_MAGML|nr:cytochrome c biogenesis protein DipZ [Magnetospirillum molischianum]CCG40400.1 Cytochrome c biogenesis protein, transmembrane region [Magnetospirillum molischianum DSM 120]
MLLFAIAYLAGGLTVLSPCILPVLPFVFAGAERPFLRSGLPMLVGMALTFALIATLAAVGGGWAVEANQAGRWIALVLLALFGLALLWPGLAERISHPLVTLGGRLSQLAERGESDGATWSVWPPVLLGIATGLVWAPCAGPILGVILTAAALDGASIHTTLLLVAYAAGAATSLAAALLLGRRMFAAMKRSLGVGEWVRRGLGAAVLIGVAVIGLGLDTGVLSRVSLPSTVAVEQRLLDQLEPTPNMLAAMAASEGSLPIEGILPSLSGATAWLNGPPLSTDDLRGKVVLVDFWTYSCINCLRTLPYVRAWADKYREAGLVVLGIHAPEFAFEKSIPNVTGAVRDLNVTYPVAIDNDYALWRGFNNHYWPAHYAIDPQGRIRFHHFGEGGYEHTEQVIRQLLTEAGRTLPAETDKNAVETQGVHAPADFATLGSPETYLGHDRAENFRSPGGIVPDRTSPYTAPAKLRRNEWALAGEWKIESERAIATAVGDRILFRFHARDLHLVLGPDENDAPVRFRVRLDGAAPGVDHGLDINAEGMGTITGRRLYQLIRQTDSSRDRTFEIEFLSPGAQAFAFTFG